MSATDFLTPGWGGDKLAEAGPVGSSHTQTETYRPCLGLTSTPANT